MIIEFNGKSVHMPADTKLVAFLVSRKIFSETAIVEYNKKILGMDDIKNILLKENDLLEVLNFVGGG